MINKLKVKYLKKKLQIEKKNVEIKSDLIISNYKMIIFSDYIYLGEANKIYGKGNISIGENVIIGPNNTFFTSVHDYKSEMLPYGFEDIVGNIMIEQNVWIGANVIVFPNITIGEGSVIGAGSVITKSIPPLSVVAGNPGIIINTRNKEEYSLSKENKNFYLKKKWE